MKITIITGRVHKEPELRYTPTGQSVCNFTVAVSNGKNENGEWRKSDWYRVTAWAKLADIASSYLHAGAKVLVVGYMKQPKPYVDQNGESRASLDLVANEIEFLSKNSGEEHEPNQEELPGSDYQDSELSF